ncbi:hypothetical protein RJ639_012377 [Escallonia herrerae]|uniref:EF-hand domain-containing protein n=1 Tax=Escallonia herrerae TaxID=1293975 RepID=A0AA88VT23_9ASTE|nr:hypothetical protein RJ639_012377 [Escallonia herrerae]
MCPTGSALHPETTAKKLDLRSAFDVLDVDRDGKISRDDLQAFYGGYSGAGASEEDVIGSMMWAADSNRDGFVQYEEFEEVLQCQKSTEGTNNGGVMEEVFRVMDRDGDGKVSHGDLKSYLSWAGFDAGDEEVKAMIRLGGGDEDGGVTYEGLLKILAV